MKLSKEQELLSTILNEAWESDSFKSELIANPVDAIESLTGKKVSVPQGKRLIVLDQTNSSEIYINIPPKPELEDVELSEDQLDIISGGGDGPSGVIIVDPAASLGEIVDG